jgi:hypothetical protein
MGRYDVHVPREVSHLPPSPTQKRLIEEMSSGAALIGRFDVWGGYDWRLKHKNGMVSSVTRATVQGLLDRGLVKKGDSKSIGSGTQEIAFALVRSYPNPEGQGG